MNPCSHTNSEAEFYTPLEPGQIRVLKVENITKLSFSLQVVSLGNSAKYGALSYVWGDSTLCKQISIQGKAFWVTNNLFIALDQFRRGIEGKKVNPYATYLWIDAICINQGLSAQAKAERNE